MHLSRQLHSLVATFILLAATSTALQQMQCCSMTEAELTSMIGKSSSCPKAWSCEPFVFEKCAACEEGKCGWLQANGRQYCICPETFIAAHKNDADNQACLAGYGQVWPQSAGGSDARLASCDGTAVDVVRDEDQNDGCGGSGSGGTTSADAPEEETKGGTNNVGTIVGASIGGIAAITAAVIGARCARKKEEGK